MDLPVDWAQMAHQDLHSLAQIWQKQKATLEESGVYKRFLEEMRREIAIETGIIERLYTLDRGVTRLLIEQGIDESLIPHGATDRPVREVASLIRDHDHALEHVFDFVGNQRQLSTSFIKQLHQLLTRHQDTTEAVDQFGHVFQAELLKGEWKQQPNNPQRPDGDFHIYCPPEQVSVQMENLVSWHVEHHQSGVSPEVESAWLHHRFTQIHPFQDGNGRVARLLASLVLIRAGWFPLVVVNDDRERYIHALELADNGDLSALVDLFARSQRRLFRRMLSLTEDVLQTEHTVQAALDSIVDRLTKDKAMREEEARKTSEQYANILHAAARDRLTDLRREIELALRPITENPDVHVTHSTFEDKRDHYYYNEIIETAKHYDYFANVRDFRSWVRLSITLDDIRTHIFLSFHSLGYQPGIKVCAPIAFRQTLIADEDGEKYSPSRDLEPLVDAPFQFTYLDEIGVLQRTFSQWLEDVLVNGMNFWRRSL